MYTFLVGQNEKQIERSTKGPIQLFDVFSKASSLKMQFRFVLRPDKKGVWSQKRLVKGKMLTLFRLHPKFASKCPVKILQKNHFRLLL